MNNDIQVGKKCTLKINPESPAAYEFGEEITGCIMGRDRVFVNSDGTLDNWQAGKVSTVEVIQLKDECGTDWNIPQSEVDKIICE